MNFDQAAREHRERMVFKAFEDRLTPLLAEVAPDWLLHHMELRRVPAHHTRDYTDQVEIRLILKGIGETRFASPREPLPAPVAKLGAPPVGPCRVNPQYGGVSNCNFGTLGCTEAGHRAEPGGAG